MGNSSSSPSTASSQEPGQHQQQQQQVIDQSVERGIVGENATQEARSGEAEIDHQIPDDGERQVKEATQEFGTWYIIRHGYTDLVNLIIRPPRAEYSMEELGPKEFTFCEKTFKRTDLEIKNERNLTLKCSHWEPTDDWRPEKKMPCLVYLHGNSSCRIEAISCLRVGLANGMTVFSFDFSGCGKSDGKYISLGFFERGEQTEFLPLGYGDDPCAASALLHADRDHSIAGLILDSAFANLEQLAQEIVEHGRKEGYTIPGFLVNLVLKLMRSSVQKRAGFDLKNLSPIDHADRSFVPALFVAAKDDDFIKPHHSQEIYEKYAGDKNLISVEGNHNTTRPQFMLDSAAIFLHAALQVNPAHQLHYHGPSRFAPWHGHRNIQPSVDAGLQSFKAGSGESPAFITRSRPMSEWSCSSCTYINPPSIAQCLICWAAYDGELYREDSTRQVLERTTGDVQPLSPLLNSSFTTTACLTSVSDIQVNTIDERKLPHSTNHH